MGIDLPPAVGAVLVFAVFAGAVAGVAVIAGIDGIAFIAFIFADIGFVLLFAPDEFVSLFFGGVGCIDTLEKPAAPILAKLLMLKKINKAPRAKPEITTNLAVFFIIRIRTPIRFNVNNFRRANIYLAMLLDGVKYGLSCREMDQFSAGFSSAVSAYVPGGRAV